MAARFEYLSCDIVTLLGFGHPLKMQTDESYRFMCKGMAVANYYINTCLQFFRLHQLKLARAFHIFSNTWRARYKSLVEKMIRIRMSEEKDVRYNLFAVAFTANAEAINPGEGFRMS